MPEIFFGSRSSARIMSRRSRPPAAATLPKTWRSMSVPLIAYFEWDSFLSVSYGVVYDETDEIAQEPEQRSAGWHGARPSSVLDCPADVRALGGHFYAAHISC
jgi:hypothetical protein